MLLVVMKKAINCPTIFSRLSMKMTMQN